MRRGGSGAARAKPSRAARALGPGEPIADTRTTAALFDRVAPRYDLLNKLMSLGQDARWRARLARALGDAARGRVLDLGCGTGDSAIALARDGAQVVGLDPSRAMLRGARAKDARIAWVQGDALHLPFKAGSFDGSASAFVLRNLPDRGSAFAEQARVLRKGGVAAHLELVRPARGAKRAVHALFVRVAVPALGVLSSSPRAYRYLARTVMSVPPPETFAEELCEAGFSEPIVERMALDGVAIVAARRSESL